MYNYSLQRSSPIVLVVTESRLVIQDVERHNKSSETEVMQENTQYQLLNALSKQLYTYTHKGKKDIGLPQSENLIFLFFKQIIKDHCVAAFYVY